MQQLSTLQSLDLIIEDVSAEINLSINSLEQYAQLPEDLTPLKKSLVHLNKLRGVFTLLEMLGALQLVKDAIALIKTLPKKKAESRPKLFEIITTALARLMRYIEHVNQKPCDLPQLLLPAINSMRDSINAPLLSESEFFECDFQKVRGKKSSSSLVSQETAEKSRHFRQMYQIGLIEVLRQTNVIGGLKMMQRAMLQLDSDCPRPKAPNMWWIAEAMLEGFIESSIIITTPRLKIFSRLDRQIREVENKPEYSLKVSVAETKLLTKEMLYLCSISGSVQKNITNLLAHFNIQPAMVSDADLRKETQEMRGPSDQDYSSISEALLEEIESITNALYTSRENSFEPLDLNQALKQMINLSNLLKILQVEDQRVRLKVAIELIEKAIKNKKPIKEKDTNILFIVMESISKVITESDLGKYSSNASVKRSKLTAEQLGLCEQTIKHVRRLIQQFEKFTQQDRKVALLKDIHGMLDDIKLGFKQLKVKPAVEVIDGCFQFIDSDLTSNPKTTSDKAINLFADIIGSLEFYLETLKYTSQPSVKILEFGQNSLAQLKREKK